MYVKSHDTCLKMEGSELFCAACGDSECVKNVSNQRKIGSTMNKMMKDCYCHYQNNVKHLL